VSNLRIPALESLSIPAPPLDEQRRIATILGALDDKIELLQKMNRTLEELAQALFKSWFIDFDGHDDLVDSEIGPVPRGWRVGSPDAFVELDPTIPLRKGTEAVYADMKVIPTSGPAVSEWTRRAYAGGTRFQQGDTLLARITPCLENGKSALVDFLADGEVAFGSTEFIVLRPRQGVPRVWPYCLVRHEPFRAHAVAHMTGSSGRQRVATAALLGFRLALPPSDFLQRFGLVTDPLFERITANTAESRTLTDLRDTLLPKLISGELRVPEAEGLVEAAV
jgi:type I restriction enzyme S subunit